MRWESFGECSGTVLRPSTGYLQSCLAKIQLPLNYSLGRRHAGVCDVVEIKHTNFPILPRTIDGSTAMMYGTGTRIYI